MSRFTGDFIYRLIAEADGPVHQAVLETNPLGCTLGTNALADGKYTYDVYPARFGVPPVAIIAGNVTDSYPRLYLDFAGSPAANRSSAAGLPGVLEETSDQRLILHDWGDPAKTTFIWSPAQDNGLQQNFPFFQGQALFWWSDSLAIAKEKVYTASAGVADLLSFGMDPARGAAALGTDGHDLVWEEGNGLADVGGYASVSVMTSRYTTTPNAIVHRRLRSDSPTFFISSSRFRVGCGFAARFTQLGTWGDLVVRLSDGQSWFLTGAGGGWTWMDPIAITCTELFAVVAIHGGARTIARVHLDSLGPGMPAD